ncbi:hypothetical protein HBI49_154590 [Parastagonospora nodorum]|nr:hypothetical protein HBI09_160830 [Parastagonospora nodorum]KAH4999431.1 hypothetical protein HBI77_172340 [Parastagonospora nodorum]KAH5010954.1 hypothetical protein HBI74_198880 [Parastagonospora nodorum]KAH5219407.1 hypothetical protein HBI62_147240 [Parastagonospora nodorum]KAH5356875.1 hypothetical protein HBI49_154590 [Parastagonospora nodorum]
MIFSTIITLLPIVSLAAPAALQVRPSELCAPTSYALSKFVLSTSSATSSVAFSFQSVFAPGPNITDAVLSGATCSATGNPLPNNNECSVEERKLLFDLAGPPASAKYRITHTWTCDGATWMSGNDVAMKDLDCSTASGVTTCTGGPQTVEPQNLRKTCGTPTCPT